MVHTPRDNVGGDVRTSHEISICSKILQGCGIGRFRQKNVVAEQLIRCLHSDFVLKLHIPVGRDQIQQAV